VELSGCEPETLESRDGVEEAMVDAAVTAKATVLDTAFHQFHPTGVSGVVVIAESHFSIHTWPERGYAALDFYTCGDIDPRVAMNYMFGYLQAKSMQVVEVERGVKTTEDDNKFTSRVT
jgi:S-adenosylmethionine decarboxylase proenzyme